MVMVAALVIVTRKEARDMSHDAPDYGLELFPRVPVSRPVRDGSGA